MPKGWGLTKRLKAKVPAEAIKRQRRAHKLEEEFNVHPNRIIVIGPNKCGTSSLHHFFQNNDLKSIHWDNGRLAKRIVSNISANRDPFEGYHEYTCFSDLYFLDDSLYISPLVLVYYIYKYYPNDIYILNTRKYGDWAHSRENHSRHGLSIDSRLDKCIGSSYSPDIEFAGYKEITKIGIKKLIIFDLDDCNKFATLSKLMEKYGFNINNKSEIHLNITKLRSK